MKTENVLNAINNASNDGIPETPYVVEVEVVGTSPFLCHRWNVEGVESKSKAAKGSKAKKTDDIESYVYRDADGFICIPTEYFRQSAVFAAKYKQDPRSPRKSAMDLFKAGLVGLTDLCSLGTKTWAYVDRRRVQVQRNGITRQRPAFNEGWKVSMRFQVLLPEYITPSLLNEVIQASGRLVGVGDFRPTFGRFQVTSFKILAESQGITEPQATAIVAGVPMA